MLTISFAQQTFFVMAFSRYLKLRIYNVCSNMRYVLFILFSAAVVIITFMPGTAFVHQAYSQDASISIDCSSPQGTVSPLLFGTNIQWTWLGEGIWSLENDGVKAGIKPLLKNLKIGAIRFPGGTLSDKYLWRYGIGQPANRGYNPDYNDNLQKCLFGTDEYYRLLKLTGAEGIITVNVGTGSAEDAANWVEYCNGNRSTTWGKVRARNGFTEPFGIKHWELGNELYGAWEPGNTDITTYAQKVIQFANAMRQKDGSIKIGAIAMVEPRGVGSKDITKVWNRTLLEIAGNHIDFLAIHPYEPGIDSQIASFYKNGAKVFSFHIEEAGTYQFKIRARGTPVGSIYPIMEYRIDNSPTQKVSVNSEKWKDYIFSEHIKRGSHKLTISFINDDYKPPEDRNLFVSKIEVQGLSDSRQIIIANDSETFKSVMAASRRTERQIEELQNLVATTVPHRAAAIKIAVTEFNAFYGTDSSQLTQVSDLKSALLSADMIHVFLLNQIYMANFWSLIGNSGFGSIKDDKALTKRPSYYAMSLLTRHQGNMLVKTVTRSPRFSTDLLGDMQVFKDVPLLSAICSISVDGRSLILSVINKHDSQPIQTNVLFSHFRPGQSGAVYTLSASSISSFNEVMPDNVRITQGTISISSPALVYSFPPHSLTVIELRAA